MTAHQATVRSGQRLNDRNFKLDGVDGPCSAASLCHSVVVGQRPQREEPSEMNITTIGLDIAKNAFQVHGVDERGETVLRKRLRRKDVLSFFSSLAPCVVGIEACGTAHHWAREIRSVGHEVKLIAPAYVKPYVKRNKNDSADAEAICEAVGRPSMRFVPVKSTDQQSVLMLHRARDLLVRQRTMLVNALRGHLAEYGIVVAQGIANVTHLFEILEDGNEELIPALARRVLSSIAEQLRQLYLRIRELELEIMAWHKNNEQSQRLATIPGIGPITASAIVASIGDSSCTIKDFTAQRLDQSASCASASAARLRCAGKQNCANCMGGACAR